MINKYNYADGCSIKFSDKKVVITLDDELVEFDNVGKPSFTSGTGETVIEYSGLDSDANKLRSLAKASYLPSAYSSLHYHDERTEDYYVISGCAKVIINNVVHFLFPGEHIRILPGQHHQVINESNQKPLTLIVKCTPSWVRTDYHLVLV